MLRSAVRHGSTDMVRLLLQNGAHANARLILVAVEDGNADILGQLLASGGGACVDGAGMHVGSVYEWRNPLLEACGQGRRDVVRLLVQVQLLYRNVQWFRGGLVFKAHRLCAAARRVRGLRRRAAPHAAPACV